MNTFTIRFRALLPMTGSSPIENGQLIVEKGYIREIASNDLPVEGELVDLSDCLILPGFVNAHCHLSLSILKGCIPRRDSFIDWAQALIKKNAIVASEDRVFALHAQAKEMARSGITALADFIPNPELSKEYAMLPFRQTLFLELLGFLPSSAVPTAEGLELVLKQNLNGTKRIRWGLAPHASYSVSPALFREVKRLANYFKCPVSCHVAEFPEELQFLQDGSGAIRSLLVELGVFDSGWTPPAMSPALYLDSMGLLDSLLAVHLNLAAEDLDLLESRNVKAIFCPKSTRWFGREKYMPVRDLLDRQMLVGLGTDSLASNDSLNFLSEIRLAEEMLTDVSREELLWMATRGGAEAVGMECGLIEKGRPADLVGFRVPKEFDDWYSVPFESGRNEVDFLMIDGKQLFLK